MPPLSGRHLGFVIGNDCAVCEGVCRIFGLCRLFRRSCPVLQGEQRGVSRWVKRSVTRPLTRHGSPGLAIFPVGQSLRFIPPIKRRRRLSALRKAKELAMALAKCKPGGMLALTLAIWLAAAGAVRAQPPRCSLPSSQRRPHRQRRAVAGSVARPIARSIARSDLARSADPRANAARRQSDLRSRSKTDLRLLQSAAAPRRSAFTCNGCTHCVPGKPPCEGCDADTCLGRLANGIYYGLCCPDPCYEPASIPAANAAFFQDSPRPSRRRASAGTTPSITTPPTRPNSSGAKRA